jgi:hypothetical protein
MSRTVFWSWQSWADKKATRYFIEDALKAALEDLADTHLDLAVRPEQDARGSLGAVDISQDILRKIREAAAVVADVTNVNLARKRDKLMPNPNVLFEVGFAEGVLNQARVVLVANRRFGKPEGMPFDLRNRAIVYYDDQASESRNAGVRALAGELKVRLAAALKEPSASIQIELVDGRGETDVTGGSDPFSFGVRLENLGPNALRDVRLYLVSFEDRDDKDDDRLPAFLRGLVVERPSDHLNVLRLGCTTLTQSQIAGHAEHVFHVSQDRYAGKVWRSQAAIAVVADGLAPQVFQLEVQGRVGDNFRLRRKPAHGSVLMYEAALKPTPAPRVAFELMRD